VIYSFGKDMKFKKLSLDQQERLQHVISAATRLGLRDLKVKINNKEYTIHLFSGNVLEEDAPNYIKQNVVNFGK
jgi:hypothetical protein